MSPNINPYDTLLTFNAFITPNARIKGVNIIKMQQMLIKTLYYSMSYMPLPSHGNHREAPTMYTCIYPQRAPSRCGGVMEKGVVTQPPTGSRMTCGGLTASLNNIIRLSTLPCVTPPVSLSGCIAGV